MSQMNLLAKRSNSTRKELRDYQDKAVEALFDYFSENDGSPIVVVPTGGGKSLIIAEFIREANIHFPGTRFIVLSHVSELLQQNADELMNQWPDANISFYSDSLNQKDLSGDIIFGGIQSIYKKAYDLRHKPDLILVDECHLISPKGDTMYRKFFEDMKVINPDAKIVGFTATPFRAGYGYLHKGKNAMFTHIAYEVGIGELIQRGHLCEVFTPPMTTRMNTESVKMSGGDFVISQLAKAVDDSETTKKCVDELMLHGADRKKWLIFTVNIEHCTHVRDEIRSRGIECEMIHSNTDTMERNRLVDKYKNGTLRCLVNVAVFTTGFNNPAIDLVALMRPTRSAVLYVQIVGRGMRPFPGKSDCLLLDFGGVVEALGPVDQIYIKEPKGGGNGNVPFKYCPGEYPNGDKCAVALHAATLKCPHCGYDFPPHEIGVGEQASDAAVLSSQLKAKVIPVTNVGYFRHRKEGKPDCMRVEYLCGYDTYREWVHLEASGFPREKACMWWRGRATSSLMPPNTISEALMRQSELKVPSHIKVKKIGKYHEIIGSQFGESEE